MHSNDPAPGGRAVIAVIYSMGYTVTIKQPHRQDPKTKFPGGEAEEGEHILQALFRETEEETGYKIPMRLIGGEWVAGDAHVAVHLLRKQRIPGRRGRLHDQYIYLIVIDDPTEIYHLSGKQRGEDADELIEVSVEQFALVGANRRNFLHFQHQILDLAEKKLRELGLIRKAA